MRIILINPYWPYPYSKAEYTYNRIWPPLCLANCAALLEKDGHKIRILDAHLERIKPHRIKDYIEGYDKVFITSSSLDRWQCPNIDITTFLETARAARKITNEVYLMGYHGTIKPRDILRQTGAKAIIRGEPEHTIVEICKTDSLSGVKGVCFENAGVFILNPDREPVDLRTLPVPAYQLLKIRKYSYEILGRNFLLFETSRGCRHNCKFCNKTMYGKGLRAKSEAQVIEEIRTAVEKHNARSGYFIDLDFLSNGGMAEKLCDFLIGKRYKFIWTCQTRPELSDAGLLKKMKEAGCRLIHLGVETGTQKSLDYFNKNIAIEEIKESIKLCRKTGIKTLAFFLFGLPAETDNDRAKNYRFIKELGADFISLHKITPYEGTAIYQDELKINKDADAFIKKAIFRYYLKPSCLFKPDVFTFLKRLNLFWGRLRTLR